MREAHGELLTSFMQVPVAAARLAVPVAPGAGEMVAVGRYLPEASTARHNALVPCVVNDIAAPDAADRAVLPCPAHVGALLLKGNGAPVALVGAVNRAVILGVDGAHARDKQKSRTRTQCGDNAQSHSVLLVLLNAVKGAASFQSPEC